MLVCFRFNIFHAVAFVVSNSVNVKRNNKVSSSLRIFVADFKKTVRCIIKSTCKNARA